MAMKRAAFLLCWIAIAAGAVGAADLAGVQNVYILPMAHGLDQYLASRIASSGIFQVVADPKRADAFLTDRLGEAFEEKLRQLTSTESELREKEKSESRGQERAVPPSTFGRGRGTIFLVETAGRGVLWSTFEPPRSTTPKELDRTARRIVAKLGASGKTR